MILAIDVGNSRIKWGLAEQVDAAAVHWHATGAVALAQIELLAETWSTLPPPSRVAIANVAGAAVAQRIEKVAMRFGVPPLWIRAQASACGVVNRYDDPTQLGCDRWAALVAAWNRVHGPCLVVNAGTATTIDLLASAGEFRGGVILPGVALMKKALAENTAGLALLEGHHCAEPRNTADAIESGCREAQAGAIMRMVSRLPGGAPCLISGGDARAIASLLDFTATVVEHLTLEGIARLALADSSQETHA